MSNVTDPQTQPQEVSKTDTSEANLAKIRRHYEKQLEQAHIEKQQLAEKAAQLERMAQQYQKPVEDEDNDSEPYVDHRKLEKKLKKFEENIEKKIEQKAEQKAAMLIEQERKNAYLNQNPDFNEVMNDEVIQKFADKHAAVAKSILNMPDGFERQKLVYETIKALGVHKKESATPIQQKIDDNRKRPYYQPTGVGSAPYASQGDFSPGGQKNAYDKMKELQRNLRLG